MRGENQFTQRSSSRSRTDRSRRRESSTAARSPHELHTGEAKVRVRVVRAGVQGGQEKVSGYEQRAQGVVISSDPVPARQTQCP